MDSQKLQHYGRMAVAAVQVRDAVVSEGARREGIDEHLRMLVDEMLTLDGVTGRDVALALLVVVRDESQ